MNESAPVTRRQRGFGAMARGLLASAAAALSFGRATKAATESIADLNKAVQRKHEMPDKAYCVKLRKYPLRGKLKPALVHGKRLRNGRLDACPKPLSRKALKRLCPSHRALFVQEAPRVF